jgi:hypothetical protein
LFRDALGNAFLDARRAATNGGWILGCARFTQEIVAAVGDALRRRRRKSYFDLVSPTDYNFCRVHKMLRVTPAMAAGVTHHA